MSARASAATQLSQWARAIRLPTARSFCSITGERGGLGKSSSERLTRAGRLTAVTTSAGQRGHWSVQCNRAAGQAAKQFDQRAREKGAPAEDVPRKHTL